MEDYPLTLEAVNTVMRGRSGAESIIRGEDDRLLVICGPCSVHDIRAALEYCEHTTLASSVARVLRRRPASLLKEYADSAQDDLHILMR